jgi:hypothetical protein
MMLTGPLSIYLRDILRVLVVPDAREAADDGRAEGIPLGRPVLVAVELDAGAAETKA